MKVIIRTEAEKTNPEIENHVLGLTCLAVCYTALGMGFGKNGRMRELVVDLHARYEAYHAVYKSKSRYETNIHAMLCRLRKDVEEKYGYIYEPRYFRNGNTKESAEVQDFLFLTTCVSLHERFGEPFLAVSKKGEKKKLSKRLTEFQEQYHNAVNRLNRNGNAYKAENMGFREVLKEWLERWKIEDEYIEREILAWDTLKL